METALETYIRDALGPLGINGTVQSNMVDTIVGIVKDSEAVKEATKSGVKDGITRAADHILDDTRARINGLSADAALIAADIARKAPVE